MGNTEASETSVTDKSNLTLLDSPATIEQLSEETWLAESVLVEHRAEICQPERSESPILTCDLISILCGMLSVPDVISWMSTCSSLYSYQLSDNLLWYSLLKRDYRFILDGELRRAELSSRKSEYPTWTFKMQEQSLLDTFCTYLNVYKAVFVNLKREPRLTHVRPLVANLIDRGKMIHYHFSSFDMIRGINSWDGPIILEEGDLIQFQCYFTHCGSDEPSHVYVHTQIVQWSFMLEGVLKKLGVNYQGSPSSFTHEFIFWGLWKTYLTQNRQSIYSLTHRDATAHNAISWKMDKNRERWFKVRYYVSEDVAFKNPGPYPEVEKIDSEDTALPAYEFLFLMKSKE
eukprot:TRINITY_DN3834_c0_g1_i2.p1 TRINITY_DN3834_c0_g1~~TRINITY_DN3834_c0_g1_i2.p1  ORF type:complete len:345 (-),score=45.98 TRINITY_DN3834_c0_g1_i2:2065-3099(-)